MINPGIDKLVGYWAMEGAGSANEVDLFGGNNLVQNGGIGSISGKVDKARDIELSASEYFTSTSTINIGTGDLTIGFWWYPESLSETRQVLFNFGGTGGFRIRLESQKPEFAIHDGSAYTNITWGSTISAGNWYHIQGWHDSVAKRIWLSVNWGLPIYTAHTTGMGAVSTPLYIGQSGSGTYYADGYIDELYIYRRVLFEEGSWFYNEGAGRKFNQLMRGQVIIL